MDQGVYFTGEGDGGVECKGRISQDCRQLGMDKTVKVAWRGKFENYCTPS